MRGCESNSAPPCSSWLTSLPAINVHPYSCSLIPSTLALNFHALLALCNCIWKFTCIPRGSKMKLAIAIDKVAKLEKPSGESKNEMEPSKARKPKMGSDEICPSLRPSNQRAAGRE